MIKNIINVRCTANKNVKSYTKSLGEFFPEKKTVEQPWENFGLSEK